MGATTKPRKRYRPRVRDYDPVSLAINRAARILPTERAAMMSNYRAAFQALREGVATELQWCLLLSGVLVGQAIEGMGVVKGLAGHLQAARAALEAIEKRAMASGAWVATALYYQEIEHVDTFLWLHEEQLKNVSTGELRMANDRVRNVVRGAGGEVIEGRNLPAQEQLQLLGAA